MYAQVNGIKLYYEVSGNKEPVVMTLHGGPGIGDGGDNKKMFAPMEDDFSFIYFDQRGNGRSDDAPVHTYNHDQIIEDTEALRRHLGITRMALSGGSYGGMLAMEYALKYPANVSHMILRGTAASNALQRYAFENALAAELPGVDREMLENLFYGRMTSDDDLKDHFAKIYPLYAKTYTPEKARLLFERKQFRYLTHNAFFQTAFPAYDIRSRLREIQPPTLILAGRHDWITPLKFAQELEQGIPNSRLIIFEEAGHSINTDMPEKFRQVVWTFLKTADLSDPILA